MNRTVRMGVTVLTLSSLGAVVATYFMAGRVAAFNATLPDQFLFKAESSRAFGAFGHSVKIEDSTTTDVATGTQHAALTVQYGDSTVSIPVIAPKVTGFKDLTAYEESVRVLSFAPIKDGKADIKPFSDENWRAVIVVRHTAEGWDEETWGGVRVKDWTFNLYEMLPNGTITGPRQVQFRDRRGRVPAEVYARGELKKEGKPVPPMTERLTTIEPIGERTWEWQAALFAMPKAQISRFRYRTDAVDGGGPSGAAGMGWTFPLAGFSIMGVVLGCGLIMAGRTVRTAVPA